jgi:Fe-S cluster assembly protein SufD
MAPSNNESQRLLYVDNLPEKLVLEVPENGSLILNIAAFRPYNNTEIDVKVAPGGSFHGAFADFSSSKAVFSLNVHLLGSGSNCEWHLASVSQNEDRKDFETSVYHESENSEALMSNYGLCRDHSTLIFSGVSEIKKGAFKTKTRQEAKIIVFDPHAIGRASPILKIGENDVEASHAAVVGRLNEDHLFYLESRGVSEDEAKRLITLGYLKPIEAYFDDQKLIQKMDESIEKGV